MSSEELYKIIAENLCKYMEIRNVTQQELAEYMNVSQQSISNWCLGIKMPRMNKIDMICEYLDITRDELMNRHEIDKETYYVDREARDLAQFLFENPDYKILFDAAKDVKPEDILFVKEMIDRLRG